MKLPRVLFTTSTRDDRVHPGHARKMAARMLAQGHAAVLGEHRGRPRRRGRQRPACAHDGAGVLSFLWQQLGRR
jgi:prolyl oligopeptidase